MRLAALILGAVLLALPAPPASASVRITGDGGGQIGPYLQHLMAIRDSGQRVIIDGPCLSACTLVLGVIPHDRICVTRRARFGFHAAWHPTGDGGIVISRGGTQLLMAIYHPNIRNWINRRGGLTQKMKILAGRELTAMYAICQ